MVIFNKPRPYYQLLLVQLYIVMTWQYLSIGEAVTLKSTDSLPHLKL